MPYPLPPRRMTFLPIPVLCFRANLSTDLRDNLWMLNGVGGKKEESKGPEVALHPGLHGWSQYQQYQSKPFSAPQLIPQVSLSAPTKSPTPALVVKYPDSLNSSACTKSHTFTYKNPASPFPTHLPHPESKLKESKIKR